MMAEISTGPVVGPVTTSVTTSVIAPTIGTLATSLVSLAMSSFGAYAFALIPFGPMLWRIWAENARLRTENAALRTELTAEKDKRFDDAQKLLEMTRTSIAPTTVRAEGDQQFLTTWSASALSNRPDAGRPYEALSRPLPRRSLQTGSTHERSDRGQRPRLVDPITREIDTALVAINQLLDKLGPRH